jgi:hypothetical protein
MKNVANYWKIEDGYDTLYDDNAFCAYSYGSGEFYLAHFYVNDKSQGRSYKFLQKIFDTAKTLGANRISANIDFNEHNAENYTKKLKIMIGHGFNIIAITDNRITILRHL